MANSRFQLGLSRSLRSCVKFLLVENTTSKKTQRPHHAGVCLGFVLGGKQVLSEIELAASRGISTGTWWLRLLVNGVSQ